MPLIIMKGGMHQPNVLMHSITVSYSRLLGYIDLAFSCLSERVIIKEEMIISIMKPVLSKL